MSASKATVERRVWREDGEIEPEIGRERGNCAAESAAVLDRQRIDDDGARPARPTCGFGFENAIDDGKEVAERLAGAGARGDHELLFCLASVMMSVELQRAVLLARIAENLVDAGRKIAAGDELADRSPFLEARIDLDHRLRPEAAAGIGLRSSARTVVKERANLFTTCRSRSNVVTTIASGFRI